MTSAGETDLSQRLGQILDTVMEMAAGNLEARAMQTDVGDVVDALSCGINMLGEEISERLEAAKRLSEALAAEKEKTIAAQQQTIRELSTPVLQVWDGVLVLPLIGVVDTRRAQQVIEGLLDAIVDVQASAAIIDVTGVPEVDTKIADYLMRAVAAARMLGTEVIVTGVSPHNAQILVKLGVALAGVTARGSLKAGLKYALQRQEP